VVQQRDVGKTAAVGYEIGVRRTVPFSEDAVWAVVLSPEGQRLWLGGTADLIQGESFSFENGTTGTIRVNTPGSHLRLTWQLAGWPRASTVQVRVIPAKTGTTISFHQEQLTGPAERATMRDHWEHVISELAELLKNTK
jgi:uncharacterized protein YndB with AHSA1/START domain